MDLEMCCFILKKAFSEDQLSVEFCSKTNLCKVKEELKSVPLVNKVDYYIIAKSVFNILSSLLPPKRGKFGTECLVLNLSECNRFITPRASCSN